MRSITSSILIIAFVAGSTIAAPSHPRSLFQARNQVGSSFTGVGGNSPGGSVNDNDQDGGSLLNILSNNAGSGGYASSGDGASRFGRYSTGRGSNGRTTINGASVGSAYSGAGGQSPGGSVNNADGLINLLSNNAGNGGVGDSGSSNAGLA